MEKRIKISIIVPIFNAEKYLKKCLNSLIEQTLKDIEIICVDDGSTDNSLNILQNFENKDNRIKVLTQSNKKQGAARNNGLKLAQGEYIGFVDSDDYVQNDFFEKLYNRASETYADIACASVIRKRRHSKKYRLLYEDFKKANTLEEKLKVCTSIDNKITWNVWNKIYKKDFILQYNLNFDENIYFEDVNFTIKAIHLSNSIVTVPETFYYYCVRGNSTVKGKSNRKKRKDLLNVYAKLYSYCLKNNIKIPETNSYCTRIYLKIFNLIILSSKTKFEGKWIINSLKLFNLFCIFRYKNPNPYVSYDYPVDIVYTWCNGEEESFKNEREFWKKKLGILMENSNYKCQWDDNDELKYSIRSVEKYAPWVRNIYVITNSQKPKWFNDNNKVKIVDVKDILPQNALPVFNSQAIETCIPYIKDLSEHFLYSNDDMFFNDTVDKSFFFDDDGKPIVRLQGKISNKTFKKSLYAKTIVSAQKKIKDLYGIKIEYSPHHCIDSYTKTIYLECIKDFKEDFERTCYQKFRCENSIQRAIILYRAIAKKQAVMRLTKFLGVFNRDSKCIALNSPQKLKYLNKRTIKLFCFNDDINASIEDRLKFKSFLEKKYPNKSICEIKNEGTIEHENKLHRSSF